MTQGKTSYRQSFCPNCKTFDQGNATYVGDVCTTCGYSPVYMSREVPNLSDLKELLLCWHCGWTTLFDISVGPRKIVCDRCGKEQ